MAQKSKNTANQQLSPNSYIKQKARTLPIAECLINENWEDTKLAYIIVTRKHTNGNLTVGIYLIDLLCLGVKDATYKFNISETQFKNIIEEQKDNNFVSVSYVLVHNIIYAAIEFASDYGFIPHKDYAVAQYIIEEDSDEIELIEIECGRNDKPFYTQGPLDSPFRANQIIAQLERTAGPGNYDYMLAHDRF